MLLSLSHTSDETPATGQRSRSFVARLTLDVKAVAPRRDKKPGVTSHVRLSLEGSLVATKDGCFVASAGESVDRTAKRRPFVYVLDYFGRG